MFKLSYVLATAGVALVVIFDIVTGQGPPQLQNFLAGTPLQYNIPPRVTLVEQNGYQPGNVQQFGLQQPSYQDVSDFKQVGEPISAQEYEKNSEGKRISESAGYENKLGDKFGGKSDYDKPLSSSTPAPGVMGSISNAWKTLTSLGRTKRGSGDIPGTSFSSLNGDPYNAEWTQSNNQGYIYFKIPKNSICYN